jgi:YidC/Oxa1 family membrane protein insertase
VDILNQHIDFLGANLVCSASQASHRVVLNAKEVAHTPDARRINNEGGLDCGRGAAARIPYYAFALAMIGTTYYQQRQMQRASPPGASQQQQALTKFMPILFGVWGFIFPAGLVVYWTTTNLVQIAQQHFMLPKSPLEGTGGASTGASDGGRKPARPKQGPRGARPLTSGQGERRARPSGREGANPTTPDREGQSPPSTPKRVPGGGGGRNAGNRKKRRKR